MLVLPALVLVLSLCKVHAAQCEPVLPPAELYSPLVAQKILRTALTEHEPAIYPQYTDRTAGDWIYFVPDLWTSGFFPATLYAMNTRAKLCHSKAGNTSQWLELGRQWSTAEVPLEHNNTVGHDVGFLSYPFVEELAVNPENETAINAVNTFATDLALRFSPIVGCTRSWDTADPTDFEVIIDNMMNLEVLFVSASLTGNNTLREIAISHATKTMENHIRPDGSSFHVVEYNATTGAVVARFTAQGYANNSTWSRGQAWGIYGFANMYMHTRETDFLNTSRRMASYFLTHLAADGIVPWDFNAPLNPPRPADSSAAMIAVNGLLLLSQQELLLNPPNVTGSAYYVHAALQVLRDNTELAWRPAWQSLLANGTVNNPAGENLTGIVYGDYFFVTAGNTLLSMDLATC
ncbi:d-4,5 unsaturated -glucuronyl hydrolase-like protein [Sparassis crispa]|uniref:D-4,5 unsaturated-glucuronyl hydrolase-like protein n=1 Tax=Sparassis crispa TaxID=139825 RepID=A0A401GKJ0_9APHY|nr:d-4,5 unsaturated -glucuronyl hydrolase-like protein [Sparassis crispa]GBE82687.1 d-4,5 unsaturated -glucuronyl hydrolase-like protein [Sparassis crispa]